MCVCVTLLKLGAVRESYKLTFMVNRNGNKLCKIRKLIQFKLRLIWLFNAQFITIDLS